MSVHITTNHHRREPVDGYALPPDVREQFPYIDWQAIDAGNDSASFIRYRGSWYDLGDLSGTYTHDPMPDSLAGWSGYLSETYFSGVCFRWVQDDPPYSDDWLVICGSYYASGEDD